MGEKMKLKSWLKYLGYILIIFGVVYLKSYLEIKLQTELNKTFKINYVLFVTAILMCVVAGVLVGLEHFLGELKKEGKWKFNVPKFVLLVIPSLYISSLYFLSLIKSEKVLNIVVYPIVKLFKGNTTFIPIFELMLGYFLITSFYKAAVKTQEVIDEDIDTDMVYAENPENAEEVKASEDDAAEESTEETENTDNTDNIDNTDELK
jgi:hypothetical protein